MKKSLKIITTLMVVAVVSGTAMADFTIDFEDSNPGDWMNGQTLNSVAIVQGTGTTNQGARIFDSSSPSTVDPDLVVGLGNVLILQELGTTTPNDARAGGLFTFNFLAPVTLTSIDLVDIDRGITVDVTLTDTHANTRSYHVPERWTKEINTQGPNGYQTLYLTETAVQSGEGGSNVLAPTIVGAFDGTNITEMTVLFTGSGAVDNIVGTTTVPAPGALLLGAMGTSVVGWFRRRRTV